MIPIRVTTLNKVVSPELHPVVFVSLTTGIKTLAKTITERVIAITPETKLAILKCHPLRKYTEKNALYFILYINALMRIHYSNVRDYLNN